MKPVPRVHRNIRITGLVQGVFFRATACEVGRRMGLAGYVCNESGGAVYIEVEGLLDDVERFIEWCRHGPPSAIVESVQTTEGPSRNYTSFDIRYS